MVWNNLKRQLNTGVVGIVEMQFLLNASHYSICVTLLGHLNPVMK